MKKRYVFVLLAALGLCLTGCEILGGEEDPKEADLYGRWEAPSNLGPGNIVFVFMDETCENAGTTYGKWGYTYDEGDDVHLDDVVNEDFHGNGWFGWTLSGKKIQTYQMHTASEAVDPFTYEIISLSGNQMTMKEGNMGTYNLTRAE